MTRLMGHQQSTPGPWATDDDHAVETGWPAIADLYQDEANARLMAAAPELYVALKKLADMVDEIGDPNEAAHLWPILEEARAALKKAIER